MLLVVKVRNIRKITISMPIMNYFKMKTFTIWKCYCHEDYMYSAWYVGVQHINLSSQLKFSCLIIEIGHGQHYMMVDAPPPNLGIECPLLRFGDRVLPPPTPDLGIQRPGGIPLT